MISYWRDHKAPAAMEFIALCLREINTCSSGLNTKTVYDNTILHGTKEEKLPPKTPKGKTIDTNTLQMMHRMVEKNTREMFNFVFLSYQGWSKLNKNDKTILNLLNEKLKLSWNVYDFFPIIHMQNKFVKTISTN